MRRCWRLSVTGEYVVACEGGRSGACDVYDDYLYRADLMTRRRYFRDSMQEQTVQNLIRRRHLNCISLAMSPG